MRLLVTRPEPEAGVLAEALLKAGHEPLVEPMLIIRRSANPPFDLVDIDGLVVTSTNAIRAISGHPRLSVMRRLPLYAVGAATAHAARELGIGTVVEGGGSAQALLAMLTRAFPSGTRLLHLAGDVLAVDLATPLSQSGIALETTIVYVAEARRSLSDSVVAALRQGHVDGVILMSPRTATTYAGLVLEASLGDEVRKLVHFCISANTAAGLADLGPPNVRIAEKPDQSSLLALIDREKAQLPGRA